MSISTIDAGLVEEIDLFKTTAEEDSKIALKMEEVRSAAFNGRSAGDWQGILHKQSTKQPRSIEEISFVREIPKEANFNPTKTPRPVALRADGSFAPSHKEDSVVTDKVKALQSKWGPGFNAELLENLENIAAGKGLEDLKPEERQIIQETAEILLQNTPDEIEMPPEEEMQNTILETKEESILPTVTNTASTVLQVAKNGLGSPRMLQSGLGMFPLPNLQSAAQTVGISAAIGGGLAIAAMSAGAAGLAATAVHGAYKGREAYKFREALLTAIQSKDPNNGVLQFLEANVDKQVSLRKKPGELNTLKGLAERAKIEYVPNIICDTDEISTKNQRFRNMTNPTLLEQTVDLLKKKGFDRSEVQTLVREIEKETYVHLTHEVVKMGLAVGGGVALGTAGLTLGILPAVMGVMTGVYFVRNRGGLDNGVGQADRDIARLSRFVLGTDTKVNSMIETMALPKTANG